MVEELNNAQMEQPIQEIMNMERKKEEVNSNGVMVLLMKEHFIIIILKDKENIFGLIKENIKENG